MGLISAVWACRDDCGSCRPSLLPASVTSTDAFSCLIHCSCAGFDCVASFRDGTVHNISTLWRPASRQPLEASGIEIPGNRHGGVTVNFALRPFPPYVGLGVTRC